MPPLLTLALTAVLPLVAISCSTQAKITPNGEKLVNNNFLSKGGLTYNSQTGLITMSGDSSEAASQLAAYAKAVLTARLIGTGINAAADLGETVTDAVAQ